MDVMGQELIVKKKTTFRYIKKKLTDFFFFQGTNPSCPTAFFKPDDTHVQVGCAADNVCVDFFKNMYDKEHAPINLKKKTPH